jgi:hypothetical protein
MTDDTDRIAKLEKLDNAEELYPALEREMGEAIGYKLFTLLVVDRGTDEVSRVYTSDPESYPVKGRKPLQVDTPWSQRLLVQGEPYIGYTADDIRSVFFDHELIASLGCDSVLNLPVISDGTVIGTVNLLHEAYWYTPDHAERGKPFAQLLVPAFLAWAQDAAG